MSYETWRAEVSRAGRDYITGRFRLGELFLYAEHHTAEFGGMTVHEVLKTVGYTWHEIVLFKRVSQKFKYWERQDLSPNRELDWCHYAAVVNLHYLDAKQLLYQCARERWTVAQLKEKVKRYRSRLG